MRWSRLALLALVLNACLAPATPSRGPTDTPDAFPSATPDDPSAPSGEDVNVMRVVDGDTIVVAMGGPHGTNVRLIGIDTPERNQCFYRAATDRMRALVDGKRVRLVRDVSETDRYGRLLRYVYVGDVFVNAVMVSDGLANAATYPPDVAHALDFVRLERVARTEERGLWAGGCAV